jgi:hypothetical protein
VGERVEDIYKKLYAGVNNPIGGVPADRGTGTALKSRVEGSSRHCTLYFMERINHRRQDMTDKIGI